jgi:hypothetical protein
VIGKTVVLIGTDLDSHIKIPRLDASGAHRHSTTGEAPQAFRPTLWLVVTRRVASSDVLENPALACHACNLFKSDFETGQDEASQAEVALFQPRRDAWGSTLASMPKAGQASASRRSVVLR